MPPRVVTKWAFGRLRERIRATVGIRRGEALPLVEVGVQHEDPRDGRAEEFFGAPVRYRAAANEFVLPRELASLPLPTGDVATFSALAHVARQRLGGPGASRFVSAVRHAILRALEVGEEPRPSVVARDVDVSVIAIDRKLAEEGESFEGVVQRVGSIAPCAGSNGAPSRIRRGTPRGFRAPPRSSGTPEGSRAREARPRDHGRPTPSRRLASFGTDSGLRGGYARCERPSPMTRARLHQLLTSALVLALPACGGTVIDIEPAESDGGTADGGSSDAKADAAPDAKPDDAKVDGATDTGVCTPIADATPCSEKVTYPCGLPITLTGDIPTTAECAELCEPVDLAGGGPPSFCYVYDDATTGAKTVSCSTCAVGRKPHDLLDEACDGADADETPVACALAEMARIEAASVHAFRRLERSLAGLGADERTLSRVRRAARDEISHARRVSSLARARGGRHRPVRFDRARRATTYELALENAVEGCVRETLGVAYLAHQRAHAADPELRALADALYEDELDHAALSWELVPFFDAQLDEAERASLREAQRRALDEVVDEMGRVDPRVAKAFGYPSQAAVARIVDALRGELFA